VRGNLATSGLTHTFRFSCIKILICSILLLFKVSVASVGAESMTIITARAGNSKEMYCLFPQGLRISPKV
jgi:hypothetical protein